MWCSTGAEIIRTPVGAPNANAVAGRWVGTVRRECLDQLLIVGRQQLVRVLGRHVEHYNQRHPHRGLAYARRCRRSVSKQGVRRASAGWVAAMSSVD